jgi:hypothetical protein
MSTAPEIKILDSIDFHLNPVYARLETKQGFLLNFSKVSESRIARKKKILLLKFHQ